MMYWFPSDCTEQSITLFGTKGNRHYYYYFITQSYFSSCKCVFNPEVEKRIVLVCIDLFIYLISYDWPLCPFHSFSGRQAGRQAGSKLHHQQGLAHNWSVFKVCWLSLLCSKIIGLPVAAVYRRIGLVLLVSAAFHPSFVCFYTCSLHHHKCLDQYYVGSGVVSVADHEAQVISICKWFKRLLEHHQCLLSCEPVCSCSHGKVSASYFTSSVRPACFNPIKIYTCDSS